MRKRKNSQYFIIAMILLVIVMSVSQAFKISKSLVERPKIRGNKWLLGKGEYYKDTVAQTYHHLVSDFTLLELEPRLENFVTIEGYENSKRFLDLEVKNDTLYVMLAQPYSDTSLVAANKEYPILVSVGAKQLKSITMKNQGHIDIPANPYGSNPDGEQVYKPEDWERFVMRANTLDLHLINGGYAELFLEVDTLNIYSGNHKTRKIVENGTTNFVTGNIQAYQISFGAGMTYLKGEVQKVNLIDPLGSVNIIGAELTVDTLIVKSNPTNAITNTGMIAVICNDYIEADLYSSLDVKYKGSPKVKKKERAYGRVIDANSNK